MRVSSDAKIKKPGLTGLFIVNNYYLVVVEQVPLGQQPQAHCDLQQHKYLTKAPTAKIGIITSKNVVIIKIGRSEVCGREIANTATTIATITTISAQSFFINNLPNV